MTLKTKILKFQKLFVSTYINIILIIIIKNIYYFIYFYLIYIASTFMKISHVKCNIESGGSKLKADFSSFISTILNKIHNYKNQKDINIL